MKKFLERGGTWVAGQFLIFAVLVLLALIYPGTGPVEWRWSGAVILVLAVAVAFAGTMALGRNITPFPMPSTNGELVQHGIYAKIRHPLYAAVILAGFGWAFLWLSWPALLVALFALISMAMRLEPRSSTRSDSCPVAVRQKQHWVNGWARRSRRMISSMANPSQLAPRCGWLSRSWGVGTLIPAQSRGPDKNLLGAVDQILPKPPIALFVGNFLCTLEQPLRKRFNF